MLPAWLAGRPGPPLAISDPRGRDHAARDFKRHLKLERGWKRRRGVRRVEPLWHLTVQVR
jgi:hypothetical protein